jgi:NhaA family Na+:H+ antiporter
MQRNLTPLKLPPLEWIAREAFTALAHFLHIEAPSGVVLLVAAFPVRACHTLWEAPVVLGVGVHAFGRPLHFWINDALMTIFFLAVGIEIRREVHEGSLATSGRRYCR